MLLQIRKKIKNKISNCRFFLCIYKNTDDITNLGKTKVHVLQACSFNGI